MLRHPGFCRAKLASSSEGWPCVRAASGLDLAPLGPNDRPPCVSNGYPARVLWVDLNETRSTLGESASPT